MYNAHSYLGTDKIQTYKKNTYKYSCFYDLFKKRTFACLRIVIFDICPVRNHIVTEV
jgi:hypothetical protein